MLILLINTYQNKLISVFSEKKLITLVLIVYIHVKRVKAYKVLHKHTIGKLEAGKRGKRLWKREDETLSLSRVFCTLFKKITKLCVIVNHREGVVLLN